MRLITLLFILSFRISAEVINVGLAWDNVCTDINGDPEQVECYVVKAFDENNNLVDIKVQDTVDTDTCDVEQSARFDLDMAPDRVYRFEVSAVDDEGNEGEASELVLDGNCFIYERHDINRDGRVNIVDVIEMSYFMFKQRPLKCGHIGLDLNGDAWIDISDLVTWLNEIYGVQQ